MAEAVLEKRKSKPKKAKEKKHNEKVFVRENEGTPVDSILKQDIPTSNDHVKSTLAYKSTELDDSVEDKQIIKDEMTEVSASGASFETTGRSKVPDDVPTDAGGNSKDDTGEAVKQAIEKDGESDEHAEVNQIQDSNVDMDENASKGKDSVKLNEDVKVDGSFRKSSERGAFETPAHVDGQERLDLARDQKLYPDITQQVQKLQLEIEKERLTANPGHIQDVRVEPSGPSEQEISRQVETGSEVMDIHRDMMVQSLTLEQLGSLYYNPHLERNAAFIENFLQNEVKKESHEFHEILLSYQRARKNLLQSQAALKSLQLQYDQLHSQVWVTDTRTVTAKGVCGDNAKCQATYTFEQASLNDTALEGIKKSLDSIQGQIQNNLALHLYSVELSRLQVESYIHNLMVTCPAFRDLPRNLPVGGRERQDPNLCHQVDRLRTCISILFTFHRLPISDEELLLNLQTWTQRLVSTFLRVSTFDDHLWIINQILRCPAGISKWAGLFVQPPPIPSNVDHTPLMFGNAQLDHFITVLSTVLIPTKGRNQFLCHMQKMFTPGTDQKAVTWVMVDSDGEEDEDPQNAWLYLHENDVVILLQQLPLAAIFKHIFFIEKLQYEENYVYKIEKTSESTLYRVFAFCTCLVRILGGGLVTYNMARYRQLNKRLGRMIRQCVQFVSDHWESFHDANQGILPATSLNKLQVEFDGFFLRAVNQIHVSQRLGSWQFIADMPFGNITKDTMWKLLWLLHQAQGQSFDVSAVPPAQTCKNFVKDSQSRSQLTDLLQHVAPSEGIYLLNTMTNMTLSCSSADIDIIETITLAVFEVSYICQETRDACSKFGRELLLSVIKCHPFMLSVLTQKVHEYMDRLGPMGLYLYKGLTLAAWLPSDPDLVIVRQWLLTNDLGSPPNLLAQHILTHMNWGIGARGDRLMVPWRVHKQVATLVVEAYQRFVLGKHIGSVIMEGVKQVSAAVQQGSTETQEFNSWCWTLLLRLFLHRSSLPLDDLRYLESLGPPPDINKDDTLMPVVNGTKEKNPTACYVSLMLTNLGHSLNDFISEGVGLLQEIANHGYFKATVTVMYNVLPMFADFQKYILDSVRFQEVLLGVLQADESYFRMAKELMSYDFPGPITKLFVSMIQSHISETRKINPDKMLPIVTLWTQLILKIPKWHQDRNCCCVLDGLIQAAFTHKPTYKAVHNLLQQHYKEHCKHEKSQGVVSALMNWISSGVTLPTLLEKSSCPEFCWLAYELLSLEGTFERDSRLWSTMQEEMLASNKVSVDQALKKAIMKLKLEQAPALGSLNIYRWAQQALDMPLSHPVVVLAWQRFFTLFLGRLISDLSLPQRAGLGERFFSGMSYSSWIKKMKKQLGKTADHYLKLTSDADTPTGEASPVGDDGRKERYYKLARIFQCFQLWVDEPTLHDPNLYLPTLPPQYQADRLLQVLQNSQTPWLEFLDLEHVKEVLEGVASDWKTPKPHPQAPQAPPHRDNSKQSSSAKDHILTRLSRLEEPMPPPPIHPLKSPVPELGAAIMEDRASVLHLLQSDMDALKHYSGQFCSRMVQLSTLDHFYLTLVPQLYQNVSKQVTVALKCSSYVNPLHKCSKPGSTSVKTEEKWNDPIVQRQANENRAEYRQVMTENCLPPTQNIVICAVHTENAITMLVKMHRACTDNAQSKHLNGIACTLFFCLCDVINDNVLQYPPTQQFFSSCLDILGNDFLQQDPSKTEHILQMALDRPELAGMLSPHFLPGLAPSMFVAMYSKLVRTLQNGGLELTFMLLTKFDVATWLTEYSPSQQEVKQFVRLLSEALISCGAHPEGQHRPVFERYIGHMKILLRHKFPLYLHEVMAAILHGSSVQKVSTTCWEVLHQHCFYDNTEEDTQPAEHTYPDVFTQLSIEETRNLLGWLGHEFMQTRMNQKEATTFGLYPKWQMYVPHVAGFLQDLCKCLVQKMVPSLRDSPNSEGLESIWRVIVEAFAPWLQTVYSKSVASMPWIEADRPQASVMVKALVQVVGFAHTVTEDIRGLFYHDFLSRLWLYFATVLCKSDVSQDVISVFNLEFTTLPWQQLMPNIQVMETMAQLKEYGSSLGFNLVADITAVIDWGQVSAWYEAGHDLDIKVRYQGCLFLLLIQAYTEKKHLENPDMEHVFQQAEITRWQHLSADAFRKSCSWFLLASDPQSLLVERTSPDAQGLRLMKSASGFTPDISRELSGQWTEKRISYLHCISSLICQCTYLDDLDKNAMATVIINLLTEIETVESAVSDPYVQRQECTDMMKEVLCLLNNCNPDNDGAQVVMKTMLQWLEDSPQTILLYPCVHAASRNLASLSVMVQIVEQCLQLVFVSGTSQQQTPDPWGNILGCLHFPELNVTEFFNVCVTEAAYLLMYTYILQRLPLCQSITEEFGLIQLILDWTDRAKPSAENESKLLLWWHRLLDLTLRQLDCGGDMTSGVGVIRKLTAMMQGFGEDRTGGLLRAIGLGKKSQLTEQFRVCCRALVAFCSNQIVNDSQFRLKPSDPVTPLQAAKQDLHNLLSLKNNKKYQPIKAQIETICDYVTDQSKCLRDVLPLICLLRESFYPTKLYLAVIR